MKSVYSILADGYDVVVLNHAREAELIIPALHPQVTIIAVQHNDLKNSTKAYLWNSRYFDFWVGVSPTVGSVIERYAPCEKNVVIIPNGIDIPKINNLKNYKKNYISILYVGRIK